MSGVGARAEDWRTVTLDLIVCSDVALVRQSLSALLATEDGLHVRGDVAPGQLATAIGAPPPDAVVLALTVTPDAGPALEQVVAVLDAQEPPPALVVIGPQRNGLARSLVNAGLPRRAFLVDRNVTDVDALVRLVRDACAGFVAIDGDVAHGCVGRAPADALTVLTSREYEVLGAMAEGLSNQAIATRLHLTLKSIEAHITQIFRKLRLDSDGDFDRRVQAARMFGG